MKIKILKILIDKKGECVSGQYLADCLSITRNAVNKHIRTLKNEGYLIKTRPNKGYFLEEDADIINVYAIQENLKDDSLFTDIIHLKEVNSTSTYLKMKSLEDIKEGTVVISDMQSLGRGRRLKYFHSPTDNGIYMSFILKLDILIDNVTFLTIISSVAVVKALRSICKIDCGIKWVNDIFYEDKKLCGILTESSLEAESKQVENVIIGIGLNVNSTENFPNEFSSNSIAIKEITKGAFTKNDIISEILNIFNEIYTEFIEGRNKEEILNFYREKSCVIGKDIEVIEKDNIYKAVAKEILDSGNLLVVDESGIEKVLISSEISVKKT